MYVKAVTQIAPTGFALPSEARSHTSVMHIVPVMATGHEGAVGQDSKHLSSTFPNNNNLWLTIGVGTCVLPHTDSGHQTLIWPL